MNLQDKILKQFESGRLSGKTEKEICILLSIPHREQKIIGKTLRDLCDNGLLCFDRRRRYFLPEKMGGIVGKVSANKNGYAFLIPDDRETYPRDFFIPRRALNGALHGDKVLAIPRPSVHSDDEVGVLKIIERGYTQIVGTYFRRGNNAFLAPDEEKYATNVFIPYGKSMGARNGMKVVARITAYFKERAPEGEIIEILGEGDDFFVEELSLIRAHGLREEFPADVLKDAKKIPQNVSAKAKENRLDLRDKLIITVDGEDTRDIDDAISIEKEGKYYILGVHIADVTHYVKYKSTLDKEAFKRATSVYFPDRVLPMLPQELSNGICSLNEGVDRLTLSCIMKIDQNGKVIDRKIAKSIINSTHRMTYHDIEKIFHGDREVVARYPDLVEYVQDAFALTDVLKSARRKRGEIELDVKEAKILIDEDCNITIPDYQRLYSQQMIEQFMVLANEQVAQFMTEQKAPFVYRIHEKPKAEKAEELKQFLISLGIRAKYDSADVKPFEYREILQNAEGMPVFSVINRVMLRSMMKAKYSPVNVGHFGLSSKCYCHFTSPIRRYPDLCIHRIIKMVLDGEIMEARSLFSSFVDEAALQSSECEKKAVEAERDVDDLYKVMYMSEKIGEKFEGTISGVTARGLFVELPNTVEGFVPYISLPDDDYEYLEERFLLRGRQNAFRIGDSLTVQVAGVDWGNRDVNFQFINKL